MKSFGYAGLANRRVRDQAKSPEAAGLHDGGGLSKVKFTELYFSLWKESLVAELTGGPLGKGGNYHREHRCALKSDLCLKFM